MVEKVKVKFDFVLQNQSEEKCPQVQKK